MITTVIGAYPKPSFLKLPDWFKVEGGIDTEYPTEDYNKAIKSMVSEAESIFLRATKEVIEDQIECGIDIVTDGKVKREIISITTCRHLEGIDCRISIAFGLSGIVLGRPIFVKGMSKVRLSKLI